MRKLCLSRKFAYQEIRWNYGILRSVSASTLTKVLQIITKNICILLTDYINSSILNGQFQTQSPPQSVVLKMAFLNLLDKWQSYLNKSGAVGTVLLDLSKAFDCLPPWANPGKTIYLRSWLSLKTFSESLTRFFSQFMIEDFLRSTTRLYSRPLIIQHFLKGSITV